MPDQKMLWSGILQKQISLSSAAHSKCNPSATTSPRPPPRASSIAFPLASPAEQELCMKITLVGPQRRPDHGRPRHEKGLGENNFCVLGQQAGRPQHKSRAIFWQRSCRQHKQRGELLVGYIGRRKNLLKAAFGESLHSSWGYQGDLRHISCLGCELPRLQQPQVL